METREKLKSQNERVKSIDIHETLPWALTCHYDGKVCIWNYITKSEDPLRSLQVSDTPVRTGKFCERKGWFIVGSDDNMIRIYDDVTLEKVIEWQAHDDFARSISVHPSRPLLLSSSDDKTIKLWDLETFKCLKVFEGHFHYVMQVSFNISEPDTFASASLDNTVRIWSLDCSEPLLILQGHSKGVNCIDFSTSKERPLLASGSDDT